MKKTIQNVCFSFFFAVLFLSCGYHFEGGSDIYSDVTHVAVQIFENKSSETRAEISFTNALIREIIEKTDTKVVEKSKAGSFIQGTINSITFSTLSRSTTEVVNAERITAAINLRLINKDGELIWSVKNFKSHEDYTVSEINTADQVRRMAAIDKIARRTAEKIVSTLQSDF